jgi:hypothetical protein
MAGAGRDTRRIQDALRAIERGAVQRLLEMMTGRLRKNRLPTSWA